MLLFERTDQGDSVFLETPLHLLGLDDGHRSNFDAVALGKNSGLMRSFISRTVGIRTHQEASEPVAFEMIVRFLIPEYRSIWQVHVDESGLQMYSRFFLIDQVTVYRKMLKYNAAKTVILTCSNNLAM